MAWDVEICAAPRDSLTKTVENFEDGLAWVRDQGYGNRLDNPVEGFRVDFPDFKQFGTNHQWVTVERRQP